MRVCCAGVNGLPLRGIWEPYAVPVILPYNTEPARSTGLTSNAGAWNWLLTLTMLLGVHGTWQPLQRKVVVLFKMGSICAANDTLAASPLTATSGQPGPVAMVHAMG